MKPTDEIWDPPCPVCGAACDSGNCECPRCETCGRTGVALIDCKCVECIKLDERSTEAP